MLPKSNSELKLSFIVFNRSSVTQKAQLQSNLKKPSTNEEIIARLESELAATKLHLQAEKNGRIATRSQLHSANLRIDQLHAENIELQRQLQQAQAQLNTEGPLSSPLKKLIDALPAEVQTTLNNITHLYSNGRRASLISDD